MNQANEPPLVNDNDGGQTGNHDMLNADPSSSRMPLTLPQLDFWEEFSFRPEQPIATVAHCLDVNGVVSESALVKAITATIAESDVLSVRFHVDADGENPLQSCDSELRPLLKQFDLRGSPSPVQDARARMEADIAASLDLRGDALSAQWLFRIGEVRYLWYTRSHHIVLDGYSIALIERRCGQLYSHHLGLGDAGPGFHRFANFLAEEASYRQSGGHEADRAFWHDYLAGPVSLPVLDRGNKDCSQPHYEVKGELPAEISRNLRELSAQIDIGWPDLLVLLSALYLFRCLPKQQIDGREVMPVWLPFMSRWGSVASHMPAMLVNILPFYLYVAPGETIGQVVCRCAVALKKQRRHGRYRIEQIAIDHGLKKGSRYFFSPLINVLPFSVPIFHGCEVTRHILSNGQGEGIDLTFRCDDDCSRLTFAMSADSTMFTKASVARHHQELPAFLGRTTTSAALACTIEEFYGGVTVEGFSPV